MLYSSLVFSLTVLYAADPTAQVSGIADTTAAFRGLIKKGDRYELAVGTETMLLRDVARVTFRTTDTLKLNPKAVVILPDTSELWGELLPEGGEILTIRTTTVGTLKVPLEKVRGIVFPPSFPRVRAFERFRLRLRSTHDTDTVYSTDGTAAQGIVERVSPEKIVIDSESLGALTFPGSRVRGVALAPVEPWQKPDGVRLGFVLADGCLLWGTPVDATGGLCTIKTIVGLVRIGFSKTNELLVSGGSWVYLDAMEPTAVVEKSMLGDMVWPYRRNVNVMGGPLRMQQKRYHRGLGVHSYSKLTYRLHGRFTRFRARAGLDESAVDENLDTRFGNVVFAVYVDGEKRFDSGAVSWNDSPQRISLDVTGADTLDLVVDTGAGLHVRDRADWVEARILRAPGGSK